MNRLLVGQCIRTLLVVLAITSQAVADSNSTNKMEASLIPKVLVFRHFRSQWTLRIKGDGSGTLSFGSGSTMGFVMPKTFDMRDVYQQLLKNGVITDKQTDLSYEIAFPDDLGYSQRGYVADRTLWSNLVKTASENLFHDNAKQIRTLLSSHPPDGTPPRGSDGDTNKGAVAVTALKERSNRYLEQVASSRSRKEEDIAAAVDILKQGKSPLSDDVAMVALAQIAGNLGARNTNWSPTLASNYYACVEHLKVVELDSKTRKTWREYTKLSSMVLDLSGGDPLLAIVVRMNVLGELSEMAERGEREGKDVVEMRAFIRSEAKVLLAVLPEPQIMQLLLDLAEVDGQKQGKKHSVAGKDAD